MSRVNQEDLKENVAKGTIQWDSNTSKFKMYNRTTKENIFLDMPFRFVVLEKDYVSFNGFNEEAYKGFWSNEVKNATDLVTVKLGNEIVAEFQKQDWNPKDKTKVGYKDKPELKGCKYTQILYIATKLEGDTKEEIYRLMLNGSSFSGGITTDKKTGKEHEGQEKDGWIRFLASLSGGKNAVYQYMFIIEKAKSKKNGAVNYTMPIFEAELLEGDCPQYNEMAEQVEEWFKYYLAQPTTKTVTEPTEEPVTAEAEDTRDPWDK